MAKNTGLGKGLEALFTDKSIIEDIKNDAKEEKRDGEIVEKIKIIDMV